MRLPRRRTAVSPRRRTLAVAAALGLLLRVCAGAGCFALLRPPSQGGTPKQGARRTALQAERRGVVGTGDSRVGTAVGRAPAAPAAPVDDDHWHDYNRASDDGARQLPLPLADIDRRLAARLHLKLARNFDAADKIRDDLMKIGVNVHDGYKLWRVDGQEFRQERYTREGNVPRHPEDDVDAKRVDELIGQRVRAKKTRQYGEADRARGELERIGVVVDDRSRTWHLVSKSWGHSYTRGDDGSLDVNLDRVDELLKEREEAKRFREYARADRLQEMLLSERVRVDDRERKWFAVASSGSYNDDGGG